MALEYIFTNNAKSTLASAMGGSDTSAQVGSGDGALFPDPTEGSERFVILVFEGSANEFMICTARASDVMTVTRSGSNSFSVGASVRLVLSADILNTLLQKGVYRTCDGDPDGVETAAYAGEEIFDSTNEVWYKACPDGTTWKAMNGDGS